MNRDYSTHLKRELTRLARFGANLADAYSCLIFLPSDLCSGTPSRSSQTSSNQAVIQSSSGRDSVVAESDTLDLVGVHTLSNAVIHDCRIKRGNGLVGWVATHRRAIHVSPFERDSTTLGTYTVDQQLKSFIGIPVTISAGQVDSEPLMGVITCDSKKSFAFSKLQGKLLEDLAEQVASVVQLSSDHFRRSGGELDWPAFMVRTRQLAEALGGNSIEVLRVRLTNLNELECSIGTPGVMDLLDQVQRLVQQALPPHFPSFRTVQGDLVLALDNMMTQFYENKIRAIGEHISAGKRPIEISFSRQTLRQRDVRREGSASLEDLISSAAIMDPAHTSRSSGTGQKSVTGTTGGDLIRRVVNGGFSKR